MVAREGATDKVWCAWYAWSWRRAALQHGQLVAAVRRVSYVCVLCVGVVCVGVVRAAPRRR